MLKLPSMHWREQQVNAFNQPISFKQDVELIEYIHLHNYTSALAQGDVDYFQNYINFVDHGPVEFCIYILNEKFSWDDLASKINYIIEKDLVANGIIYLSINKFLAEPAKTAYGFNDDYDLAIGEYVKKHINASIENYYYKSDDCGQYFNFAHPTTRFYLRKNNDNN